MEIDYASENSLTFAKYDLCGIFQSTTPYSHPFILCIRKHFSLFYWR